jgi:cytochrome d ubiquinol oxidase subunit I
MNDLLAARSQMAMSLAFHIIFAAIGVAMPLLMVIAEWRWLRSREDVYLELAKRWAKGTAILFAVGAVSGTVLSFELGLLWPRFMGYAGAIIGMPFSLEGFAFFTEAIFLGIYLYGGKRVPPRAHLLAGVVVALSGTLSGIFVVIANSWMNNPGGFELLEGKPVNIDPVAAMLNPMALSETIHMTIAAYAATGFVVAGIHAYLLLRDRTNLFHRRALGIALAVGGIAAILQPVSGDLSARYVARYQPAKLAALEAHFNTEAGASLSIGGIPDIERGETKYAIRIPYGLSLLAFHDPHAVLRGSTISPATSGPTL